MPFVLGVVNNVASTDIEFRGESKISEQRK